MDSVLSSRAITEEEAFQCMAAFLKSNLPSTWNTTSHLEDLFPVAESLAVTDFDREAIRQLRATTLNDVASAVVSPMKQELTSAFNTPTFAVASPVVASNKGKANASIDTLPSSAADKHKPSEHDVGKYLAKAKLEFGRDVVIYRGVEEQCGNAKKTAKKEAKKKKRKRDV